jgi:hypothetical protein
VSLCRVALETARAETDADRAAWADGQNGSIPSETIQLSPW